MLFRTREVIPEGKITFTLKDAYNYIKQKIKENVTYK